MAMVTTMAPRFMFPDIGGAAAGLGEAAAAAAPVAASAGAAAAVGAMGTDLAGVMSRQQYANAAVATAPQNWTAGGRTQEQWQQHVLTASEDHTDPYDPRTFSRRQATEARPGDATTVSTSPRSSGQSTLIDRGSNGPFVTPIDATQTSPHVTPLDAPSTSPFTTPAGKIDGQSRASTPAHQDAGIGNKLDTPAIETTASDNMLLAKQLRVFGSDYPDASTKLNATNTGPGKWIHVGQSNSERAADYQQQISGVPFGNEYLIDGKKLDGVGTNADGSLKLIEAKGPGLANKLDANGKPQAWFQDGFDDQVAQLVEQAQIAGNYGGTLEVHVAEKSYADALRSALRDERPRNVDVLFTPPK